MIEAVERPGDKRVSSMTASVSSADLPLNLHEYEAAARDLLPPSVWAYVSAGSGDEVTLRGNRAAFDRWRLLPRTLAGLREVSTATSLLGQPITLPVVIAPSGRHRLCHDDGERATARAANAAGTIYTMSSASSFVVEEIAPDAGPWWFQLYVFTDRGFTRELVERATAAGAAALVVTVDVPVRARRDQNQEDRHAPLRRPRPRRRRGRGRHQEVARFALLAQVRQPPGAHCRQAPLAARLTLGRGDTVHWPSKCVSLDLIRGDKSPASTPCAAVRPGTPLPLLWTADSVEPREAA